MRFGKAAPLPSPGSDPEQHPRCSLPTGVRQPFAMGTTFAQPLLRRAAMETGIIPSPLSRARPGLAL